MGMRVVGLREVQVAVDKLAAGWRPVVERTLFELGSEIEGEAKTLCPVDTGALRDSGFTLTPTLQALGPTTVVSGEAQELVQRDDPRTVTAVVGFGGPAQVYAIVQHERTDFHHAVGQAKYLEQPFLAHAGELAPRLQAAVEAFVAGRGGAVTEVPAEGGEGVPGTGFE